MAEKINIFTKQHINVLNILNNEGRYVAKRQYAANELDDQQKIMWKVYDWLACNIPDQSSRPDDAEMPIWVSYGRETTMRNTQDFVILEFEIDKSLLTKINISKWGAIMNYSYIPRNEQDRSRHEKLLSDYCTNDAKCLMTDFYPHIKSEIINSWSRLFDDSVILEGTGYYGILWELKKEWLKNVDFETTEP